MKQSPIGISIVGMGFMGKVFAQICRQLPDAHLVGVADVVEKVGRAAAETFGVPYYSDYADLIARPEVQAVIVATPEDTHVGPSVAALERGKAVLVEKPIADNLADAEKIAAANQDSKAVLMVGHVLRYHTHYLVLKQLVDEGQIGAVQYMQTRRLNSKAAQDRLKGRSSLPMFLGVHDYDIVRWFAGSEPVRVYAESQSGVLRELGYPIEDSNWALITFQNGALAICETGWILPAGHPTGSEHGLIVQGSQGRLDLQLMHQGMVLSTEKRMGLPDTSFLPKVYGEIRGCFVHEVQHFLTCVREGTEPRTNAADAIVAVRIAEAVLASARTHQPVAL